MNPNIWFLEKRVPQGTLLNMVFHTPSKRLSRRGWIAGTMFIAVAVWGSPTDRLWEAGVSYYAESGTYGTDTRSTISYVPFSLRRFFEWGDLKLTVPFISVTSDGQVVVVGGVPQSSGRASRLSSRTSSTKVTNSGLGDIQLQGRTSICDERDWFPSVDAVAKIKFPTASRTKGLGTGEFDEGLGLELTKTLSARVLALAELGYTFIGSPPDQTLQNQWRYAIGPGYYFIPEKLLGSMSLEESRALVSGEPNPMDLLFSGEYHARPNIRLQAGFLIGLTRSAPDVGFSIGAQLKFDRFAHPSQ